MQPPKSAPSPERLTQFAFGFAPPLILQTAVELQIFDLIYASPMSLEELSSKTGASVRGLRALLNALVGFEFLSKDDGGRYALTPESEAFLAFPSRIPQCSSVGCSRSFAAYSGNEIVVAQEVFSSRDGTPMHTNR
jgi:hypothetical protein